MGKSGTSTKRLMCDGAKANPRGCTCALERAQHVQGKLSPQFASCVKLVNRSERTYLALPRKFCYEHLPNLSHTFVFVGENEKEFSIEYSADWFRFSVGWARFFTAHSLLEGDALVFHLIKHCKLKVYIVRSCRRKSCRRKKVGGVIRNPNVGVSIDTDARIGRAIKKEHQDYPLQDSHQENGTQRRNLDSTPPRHQRDVPSKGTVVKFQDVKRFEDFKICVDGLILDSELPILAKAKYYQLCRSQKMFLHDGLIENLGCKLVTGMISKISDIAYAITSARLASSPPLHNLGYWDRTLKAFEELGMNVGFLRVRIGKLVKISRVYQTVNESWSAKWAEVEDKDRALREKVSTMDALVESIETLKASKKSVEAEMEAFEEEIGDLDMEFSLVAAAPWS